MFHSVRKTGSGGKNPLSHWRLAVRSTCGSVRPDRLDLALLDAEI
jgi:hypothetical protein